MKVCDKCWGTGKPIDHLRLGRWARAVRDNRRLSLKQASRRLGISESHLSLLERGKRGWTQRLYDRIMAGRF